MPSPRFLFDEDVSRILAQALRAQAPTIEVLCVGEAGAPTKKTSDPSLLMIAESEGRILVSNDKSSMPLHLANHFAAGHHTGGVILVRQGFPLVRYVQDMLLVWQVTSTDEWQDRTDYIPY